MFKCNNCNQNSQPKQKLNKVITKKRERTDQQIGWEIAQEINTCPKCFQLLTGIIVPEIIEKPVKEVKRYKSKPHNRFEKIKRPEVEVVNKLKVVV